MGRAPTELSAPLLIADNTVLIADRTVLWETVPLRDKHPEVRSAAAVPSVRAHVGTASATFPHALRGRVRTSFALNFDPAATLTEHQAERSRWDERHARKFARWEPHVNDRSPDRRLRIGYVSPYFYGHSATYAFGGVILYHDPHRFEVVCYSDTAQEDNISRRLRGRADKWHNTGGLGDDGLAALIRADRIDILVDLVGHMRGHRLLAFARKPAPIQITAWGEPTGTGLAAMDYLFPDPVLVAPHERGLLAEKVVDLPDFLGYWVPDPIPEPRALPALARGYVTFGSFNRFDKIQDPVLHTWARIMNELPASRLFLKGGDTSGDSSQQERIKRVLAAAGVAGQRVHFLDWLDRNGHFAAYQDIDIAIDPFPHGGGMTTLDALWIGRSSRGLPRANHLVAAGVRDLERARIDRFRCGGSRWLCRSGSRQGFGPRHARSPS